ncbi:MAG: hypothetical protein Q8R28_22425 [Dehalococcoidia bacterium]|nr:hypothetical protein [Dehalococcoidia bacterium]
MKYTHAPLGEEVEFLAGSYQIDEEARIPYDGREVLYLLGQTGKITSCCGSANAFRFIKVVGYIANWQNERDGKGFPVSEIEVIQGDASQYEVRELIRREHPDIDALHIEFW